MSARFNPAPGWPPIPDGWTPPPGWQPDPSWPAPPPGWQFWVEDVPGATPPGGPAPSAPSPGEQAPDATHVLPSQSPGSPPPSAPSAPEGARDVPPAVPPARYAQAPGQYQPGQYQPGQPAPGLYQSGQPSNGWNSPPGERKRNHLVWILPVAALLLIGIVFGALALAGVFSDDEPEGGSAAAPTTATPTEEQSPTPEPTDESPTPADEPTSAPGGSDDPVVAAFCEANISVSAKNIEAVTAETVADYIPPMTEVFATMETMVAPPEIADAWAYNVSYTRDQLAWSENQDPSMSNIEAQTAYLTEAGVDTAELFDSATQIQDFVMDNCYG